MDKHRANISVNRGDNVGLYGHGIFSKSIVDYLPASSLELEKPRKIKQLSRAPKKGVKRQRINKGRKSTPSHSRASRSKDTLF